MMYFDGVIVVEGSNDVSKIRSIIDCETIITNGFDLPFEEIDYLKAVSRIKQVVILTDPDEAGGQIRDRVFSEIPNAIHLFADISDCNKNGKHGIAECNNEELRKLLQEISSNKPIINTCSVNQSDLLTLGLTGDNSSAVRKFVCNKLHLGMCNSKRMINRLSSLGISLEELAQTVEEYGNGD